MKIQHPIEFETYGVFVVQQLTQNTELEDMVAVDLVKLAPHQKSTSHRHNFSNTILYISKGSAYVYIDEFCYEVRSGDRLHIPPKSFHYIETKSSDLEFISIQTPPILNKKNNKLDLEELSNT